MSITDELRDYIKEQQWCAKGVLTAIADRIDAAHEDALSRLYMDMSDSEWVRLPKDADGAYVHIGDVMEWVRYKDDDPTIVRTVSGIGNGVFFAWSDEQGRYAQYEAHAYRHHQPDTWERIIEEVLQRGHDDYPLNVDIEPYVARCKALCERTKEDA